jgi:hypothetical protein
MSRESTLLHGAGEASRLTIARYNPRNRNTPCRPVRRDPPPVPIRPRRQRRPAAEARPCRVRDPHHDLHRLRARRPERAARRHTAVYAARLRRRAPSENEGRPRRRPRARVRVQRSLRRRHRPEGRRHAAPARRRAPCEKLALGHRRRLRHRHPRRAARVPRHPRRADPHPVRQPVLPRPGDDDAHRVLPCAVNQPLAPQDLAAAAGGFAAHVRAPRLALQIRRLDLAQRPPQQHLQRRQGGRTTNQYCARERRFVSVIDSRNVSLGQGLAATPNAERAVSGRSAGEAMAAANRAIAHTRTLELLANVN